MKFFIIVLTAIIILGYYWKDDIYQVGQRMGMDRTIYNYIGD